MSSSEYMGWIKYFEEKERREEVAKGNIMAMTPEEVRKQFGNAKH
jgi:hypothetical protein